jgi:ribonuclease P protein component
MRRRHRLRREADFDELWRRGKRWQHPLMLLITGPNGQEFSRFGFSVSRHFGRATERNKMKRVLREVVRSRISEIVGGLDLLFVARPSSNGMEYHEIADVVSILLRKSGALEPAERPLAVPSSHQRAA